MYINHVKWVQAKKPGRYLPQELKVHLGRGCLGSGRQSLEGNSVFHSSSSPFKVSWWLSWLFLELHCSLLVEVTPAPCTGFPVLRVVPGASWWGLSVNLLLGWFEGRALLGWLILEELNWERCCADQQWLREFQRTTNSPNHIICYMM